MNFRTITSIIIWASLLTALALLSSCSKHNTNPFQIYFYTTNKKMPDLYLKQNNGLIGKVPLRDHEPEQLDTAEQLRVTAYDVNTSIDAVDAQGHVIQVFNFKLNDDGSFKQSGGGYLLYDTWQKEPYHLLIRLNGQFKL